MMKSLKYISLLIITIFIYSCGEKQPELNKLIDEDGFFRIYIKAPENKGAEIVRFFVLEKIKFDSLGIDEQILVNISKNSVVEVKDRVKHSLTFEYSPSATISLSAKKDMINTQIGGSAQNSYGVRGSISSFCDYNFEGDLIKCKGLEY